MKPGKFEFVRPETIEEASSLLASSDNALAIAGGQSLLPMMSLRVAQPDLVVDIGRLAELKGFSSDENCTRIGALTTHSAFEDAEIPDFHNGFMRAVAGRISYRSVRVHGTVGGSVALADPAADWPGCLLALGATVQIYGSAGKRSETMSSFILGQYTTSLSADELVVSIEIPRPKSAFRWGWSKVARKSGAFASSIAYAVSGKSAETAHVVLTGLSDRPLHLQATTKALRDGDHSETSLKKAAELDVGAYVSSDAYQRRLHVATIMTAVREMMAR